MTSQVRDQLIEQGYAGPSRVLSPEECRRFLTSACEEPNPSPRDWFKGNAASSRAFYEIATHPVILERVSAVLGEDVLLWGATIETRPPGAVHPWHSDIETSRSTGNAVAVWIGLENTRRDSSLRVVARSHRFGETVQEVRRQKGKGRDAATDDDVACWARERDDAARVERPAVADGEALFFDGRLWHGSHNASADVRRALLLQYASPELEVRIPDLGQLDWPFRFLSSPLPPCVLARGNARLGVNRVVRAPLTSNAAAPELSEGVHPVRRPLPPAEDGHWKPSFLFHGATAGLQSLSCHVSVLHSGSAPHPPHRHDEDELLLVLSGHVKAQLPDLSVSGADEYVALGPGELVYYPAGFSHTLETTSAEPANYLMLKWSNAGRPDRFSPPLPFGRFRLFESAAGAPAASGFTPHFLFEGPTRHLSKLHCHFSTLTPGAGYESHIDAHDVAIVVLEGEIETLGQRVEPFGVVFCPGGTPHGMHNPGVSAARYVVFEFHGP